MTETLIKGRIDEEEQIRQYEKKKRLNYSMFAGCFSVNLFSLLWPTQTPYTLFFLTVTVSQCVLPNNILPVITGNLPQINCMKCFLQVWLYVAPQLTDVCQFSFT